MIGQRPPPILSKYQSHASRLIGSPTVPRSRSDERSCFSGHSSPHLTNIRIAVGAVYSWVILCFSMIAHIRPKSGASGDPSYMTLVTPFISVP